MNLDSFKAGKEDIKFWSFTGEVISQNKYSETHVWSSGGGGNIGPRGGHVAAVQTHSSVTTKQDFWLKLDDGTEKSVQLGGYDIPLRERQKISILMAHTETSESAYYAALINHASGITHEILSASSILDKLIDFYPNAYKIDTYNCSARVCKYAPQCWYWVLSKYSGDVNNWYYIYTYSRTF